MLRLIIFTFAIIFATALPIFPHVSRDNGLDLKVISSNIRTNNAQSTLEGERPWNERRGELISAMARYINASVTVIGFQEAEKDQLDDILSGMSDRGGSWDYVGVGTVDGKDGGEFNAIAYNSNDWEVKNTTYKWLSETPNKPSKSWGLAEARGVTIVELKRKSNGVVINVMNTHLDHVSDEARKKSAELLGIWQGMIPNNDPVILTGDFNSDSGSGAYQTMSQYLDDSQIVAETISSTENTYTGFEGPSGDRIDFVWVSKDDGLQVKNYDTIDTKTPNGRFSDHLPVVVTIEIT